ncbi:MAG TPA: hypothetical protein VFM69_01240 [Pricia sp.]|nr:hypothetical protein [Pricia sp.]
MRTFAIMAFLMMFPIVYGQQSSNVAEKDLNKLAFSYGAQAFDMLEVADRIIDNQKVTLVLYKGLSDTKDLKVEVLTKAITLMEKRTFWQKLWAFLRGAIIGGAVVYVATSL